MEFNSLKRQNEPFDFLSCLHGSIHKSEEYKDIFTQLLFEQSKMYKEILLLKGNGNRFWLKKNTSLMKRELKLLKSPNHFIFRYVD